MAVPVVVVAKVEEAMAEAAVGTAEVPWVMGVEAAAVEALAGQGLESREGKMAMAVVVTGSATMAMVVAAVVVTGAREVLLVALAVGGTEAEAKDMDAVVVVLREADREVSEVVAGPVASRVGLAGEQEVVARALQRLGARRRCAQSRRS